MRNLNRVAECVGKNHPDKLADQVSDKVLDHVLDRARAEGLDPSSMRTAAEVMINGGHMIVGGEVSVPEGLIDLDELKAALYDLYVGCGNDPREDLVVQVDLRQQSPEIAAMTKDGAGDQGIMSGFATTETSSRIPIEMHLARQLVVMAKDKADDGTLPWLRYDTKSQVALGPDGDPVSVILSVQHRDSIDLDDLRSQLFDKVIVPVLGDIDPKICKINQKGSFVLGGADADCGLTGRKIVVDAYGPRVPVGGGAFSGKDPTKVDRSGAYMARDIALSVLDCHPGGGTDCLVKLAYGIGQIQPETVSAIVDGIHDVTPWVRSRFTDLSPRAIQERLGLWSGTDWSYSETAAFGHFGHAAFPWEQSYS